MNFKKFFDLNILFFLFSTIIFNNIFFDSYQSPKLFGFLIFLLLFFILFLFKNYKINFNISLLSALLLYIYFSFLSLFSNNTPYFYHVFIFFSSLFFFIPIFHNINKQKLSFLLNVLLLCSLLFGLYQFTYLNINRPYSFFGNPIFFAEFITILFPFSVFYLINNNFILLSITNIVLSIFTLILCQSRGVIFSFIFTLILFIFILIKSNKIKLRKYLIYIVIAIFLLSFFIPGFYKTFFNLISKFKNTISIENYDIKDRAMLAKSSLKIFIENPVTGKGPGAIKKYLQLKQASIIKNNPSFRFINSSYSHNDYIQIIAETGLIGLLLFLVLIFSILHHIEKNIIYYDSFKFIYTICVIFSIFFVLIESFFNFPLFVFPTSSLFFFFLGLLCSDNFVINKNFSISSKMIGILLILPIMIFLLKDIKKITSNIYLASAIKQSYNNIERSEYYFKKSIYLDSTNFNNLTNIAIFYFNIKDYNNSLYFFKKTLKYFPYSADIYYNIGLIYEINQQYEKASDNYEMALLYYPDFALANLATYRVQTKLNPENECYYIDYLHKALKTDTDILLNQNEITPLFIKEITF
jgi:O-antigen ligase